jgi:hypothetical protein
MYLMKDWFFLGIDLRVFVVDVEKWNGIKRRELLDFKGSFIEAKILGFKKDCLLYLSAGINSLDLGMRLNLV